MLGFCRHKERTHSSPRPSAFGSAARCWPHPRPAVNTAQQRDSLCTMPHLNVAGVAAHKHASWTVSSHASGRHGNIKRCRHGVTRQENAPVRWSQSMTSPAPRSLVSFILLTVLSTQPRGQAYQHAMPSAGTASTSSPARAARRRRWTPRPAARSRVR